LKLLQLSHFFRSYLYKEEKEGNFKEEEENEIENKESFDLPFNKQVLFSAFSKRSSVDLS